MKTYTCPSCSSLITEMDKQWEVAIAFAKCPVCLEPLRHFPVQVKPRIDKPFMQPPEKLVESPVIRQKYRWGDVVTWSLSAFLFGLTVSSPRQLDPISQSVMRLVGGVVFMILVALIVGIYKYFRPASGQFFRGGDAAQSADKTVFALSVVLAVLFLAMALYFERYLGLIDAAVCGSLAFGVKYGSALARILLASYAFASPLIVVFSTGSQAGALWPFLFFAVCQSILAHQGESQANALSTVQGENMPGSSVAKSKPISLSAKPTDFDTNSTESSEQPAETLEDRLYMQIAEELGANTVDKGVWTQAFAQADGDDKRTRVLYIRMRLARLLATENARIEALRKEKEAASQLDEINRIRSLRAGGRQRIIAAEQSSVLKEELTASNVVIDFFYFCGSGRLTEVKKLVEANPLLLTSRGSNLFGQFMVILRNNASKLTASLINLDPRYLMLRVYRCEYQR